MRGIEFAFRDGKSKERLEKGLESKASPLVNHGPKVGEYDV